MILGIDEVGRGPWAGPLVIGAVVLPEKHGIDGLNDSKKVSAKKRKLLDERIRTEALSWGLGWVHADELDAVGLSEALRLATIRAVEAIKAPYHQIIIDGTINFLKETNKGGYVTVLPKADALIPAVSAASIIAKVARDTYMEEQSALYPEYGFDAHVGYGTARHHQALIENGITPLHRKSFAPIAKIVNETNPDAPRQLKSKKATSTVGAVAETKVADWLEGQGFEVIERNWKTKHCEIDIIAESETSRYFIEVKYRSSTTKGSGIDAITPKKLQQMIFAAELYDADHQTSKLKRLAVVGMDKSGAVELVEVE